MGRVIDVQTDWVGFGDRSGKTVTDIEMIDCKEYLEGGLYAGLYEGTTKMKLIESLFVKHSATFLCPHGLDRLVVQGHYGSEAFRYVTITVDGCDLGPEECMADEDITRKPLNFY